MSFSKWCASRDLNPHGLPPEPKSGVSANSTRRANIWWPYRESNPGYRRERAVSWPLDHRAKRTGNVLLSQAVARQVSSALRNLTSVFGMGTGVASVLLSPDFRASHFFILRISFKYYFDCTFKTEYFNYVNIFLTFDHWSSVRPISIGQLNTLLHLHLRPIYVVVFHESYLLRRKSFLVGGFALRCFQRLSLPYLATQLCPWQNNWCTSGTSIPVLSY